MAACLRSVAPAERSRLLRRKNLFMSRESEMQQLQEIRQEILAVYGELDACREVQKRLETLQQEKAHPTPPAVPLQPENTAAALKQSFDEENRRRILGSRTPERVMQLVGGLLLAAVSVLLALELFGDRELLIDGAAVAALGETGSSGKLMLLAAHILVSLAVLFGVGGQRRADGKRPVLLTVLAAVVAVGYLFMIGPLHAWAYAALIAVCGVLLLAAKGGIKRGRLRAVKAPALTAPQKRQWEAACQADAQTKERNAQKQAAAQKEWEAQREQRLAELEREMQACGQEFTARRQRLEEHMQRLGAMDALCEEDKNLQMVELLIRLMETRRADSVKEALQEYDKLMANRQLMELEKQKLEAELRRAAEARADRQQRQAEERRYREEMEYLARDSARSRAQMVDQLNSIGNMLYYDLHF